MMKKNIFIVILMVIIFCLGGYLVFDKVSDSNSNNEAENNVQESNNQEVKDNGENIESDLVEESLYVPKGQNSLESKALMADVDDSKYTNIFDYISAQDNVSVTLTAYIREEAGDRQVEYKLTQEEINTYFSEARTTNVSTVSNIGGVANSLKIEYYRNGKMHTLSLFGCEVLSPNGEDGNIYKILDKSINEEGAPFNYIVSDSEFIDKKVESLK